MRISDGSICRGCKHFEHECNVPCEDDYCCYEYCRSSDYSIVENFYDKDDVIIECKSFEE